MFNRILSIFILVMMVSPLGWATNSGDANDDQQSTVWTDLDPKEYLDPAYIVENVRNVNGLIYDTTQLYGPDGVEEFDPESEEYGTPLGELVEVNGILMAKNLQGKFIGQ